MRIRVLSYTSLLLAANAAAAMAQEHAAAEASRGVMDIGINVMFYTLLIFGVIFWLGAKFAFPEDPRRRRGAREGARGRDRWREARS